MILFKASMIPHDSNVRQCDGLTEGLRKSHKADHQVQRAVKQIGWGFPQTLLLFPGAVGLSSGSSLGSLSVHHIALVLESAQRLL